MAWHFFVAQVEQHRTGHFVLIDEAFRVGDCPVGNVFGEIRQGVGGERATEATAACAELLKVHDLRAFGLHDGWRDGVQLFAFCDQRGVSDQLNCFFREGHISVLAWWEGDQSRRGIGASSRVNSWSCFSANSVMLPPEPTCIGVSRLVFSLRVPRLVGTL